MIPEEKEQFAEAMTRLFAVYGDEITAALLEAWWGVLQAHELREVRWGMSAHVKDPKAGRFKPLPADIIRHISETLPQQRATTRDARIRQARELAAPMEERILRLEKDIELGLLKGDAEAAARAEINGLRMRVGGIMRDNFIDDRPDVIWPRVGGNMRGVASLVKALGYDDDQAAPDEARIAGACTQ